MPYSAVSLLLSDADVVVVVGDVLHPCLALLVSVHAPRVGDPCQPHGTAVRRGPLRVTLHLPGEDVPLGGGGAGRHRHLQLRRVGRGGAEVDVHVVACGGAADRWVESPGTHN